MSRDSGYFVLAAVVVVLLGLRARRTLTPQPIRYRSWIMRVLLLLAATALLLPDLIPHRTSILAFVGGAAAGAALGMFSSRITVMEPRGNMLFYRTNTWLGGGLVLLLAARLIWDYTLGASRLGTGANGTPKISIAVPTDPVGSALWAVFIGYWVVYYLLLMRRVRLMEESAARPD